MNRKRKKLITTAAVLLFFAVSGIWYYMQYNDNQKNQENDTKLTGVYDILPTGTPTEPSQTEEEPAKELIVYVCGAVNTPGVYSLPAGSRLYEAVAMAGGFSKEAAPSYHNLARTVTDGERVYILSVSETEELTARQQVEGEEGEAAEATSGTSLLNLNTATAEQLMNLPGIGEAKAADIIEYRSKIGRFTNIEELKNVSGIGDVRFEKLKDKITVE